VGGLNKVELNSVERIDLGTLESQYLANCNHACVNSVLTGNGSTIIKLGGHSQGRCSNKIEIYFIKQNKWLEVPFALEIDLPGKAGLFRLKDNNSILLFGGLNEKNCE
jgi:hypothetical protein